MGQVFLRNPVAIDGILQIIAESQSESILEVGPGEGVLTIKLAEKSQVTAVEKDHRFALMLKLKELPNLTVVEDDFLEFDLATWIGAQSSTPTVVGNIPYNISTPIVMKIIPLISQLKEAVFMVQKEFADRVAADCGNKNYGSLSVFCGLRCKIDKVLQVSRLDFSPVPQVDSTVIRIRNILSEISPETLRSTEKLTRHVFAQRRKKLSNSLKIFLNQKERDFEPPIDFNRRPEELSPLEFVTLANWLFH